ncbi:MAG: C39 family peptidase [Bacilli bacterium]|nr:C39 family peptidase [Bacilli bacterium]
MDYQIVLATLESKASELDNLKSKVSSLVSDLNSIKLTGEISSLATKLNTASPRLETAYTNCSTWFHEYLKDIKKVEDSLANFSSSNIDAPKEFSYKFEDLFGKALMPTLKTGGDKEANLKLGSLGTDDTTALPTEDVTAEGFQNYYQGDYSNVSYGYGESIGSAGCGPTSLAMVLQFKTGKKIDPTITAKYAMNHNYRKKGNGTDEKLFPAMASEYGIECSKQRQSASNIRAALQSGKVCLMHMGRGHFTGGGHYIVLKGITKDGKAIVADPASRKRSSQVWSIDLIASETKGSMYVF